MSSFDKDRSIKVREGFILLGFFLLIVAAVITVVIPELRNEPGRDTTPNSIPEK